MLKCHVFCYYIYSKMCQTFSCVAYVDSFSQLFITPCQEILDCLAFWILCYGFWIQVLDFEFLELIITASKAQDSGFHKKIFWHSGFRLPFIPGVIYVFPVAPDLIHFLLIADGMEEQYSSIPPFNASAATPADVYKLDDSILFKFQINYVQNVCYIHILHYSFPTENISGFDLLSCFYCLEYMLNLYWESQVVVCNHENLPQTIWLAMWLAKS